MIAGAGMFIVTDFAHAQFANLQGGANSFLEVDPQYPLPRSTFTVRFANYTGSGNPSAFRWKIDGEARPEFDDKAMISLTAPALGTPLTIEAVGKTGFGDMSLTTTVVPQRVDFVFEGDTTAPYFYEGRRLPTVGAPARAIAIPHLFDTKGNQIPVRDIVFRWSINNAVVEEGRGKQVANVAVPVIGDATVELFIESVSRTASYRTIATIPVTEPTLVFHQYNPRFGLSRNSTGNVLSSSDAEVTVRAEPYFMSRNALQSGQHGWTLDGGNIQNAYNDPQMLALRKVGDGGTSEVGFTLRNLSALSQYVQGLLILEFK